MSNSQEKNPLSSTSEVAKMLGLNSADVANGDSQAGQEPKSGSPKLAGNLYVKDLPVETATVTTKPAANIREATNTSVVIDKISKPQTAQKQSLVLRILRNATPYLVIFTLAIFLYFFFFTNVDFSSVFKSQAKVRTPQQTALNQLQSQNLDGYNKWISQFYYDVSDQKVLDPSVDNSGNGLTNFQKYLLNLNPKSYDTLGMGMADSEALAKGLNPLTGNQLTDAQKQILSQYFDMETIMNRLTLAQMQQTIQVAGAKTTGDLPNQNLNNQNNNASAALPLFQNLDIDTAVPGRLQVADLNVDAPIIWSTDVKNFDTDLRSGVIHYPGTAMPGQIGTAYISGHSSNYVWAKGNYNRIFTYLGDLGKDASFKVTVTLKNGKQAVLYYVVVGSQQYGPKDQAQFVNASKSVMALSTCWPVGSTAKRLVVFGELTQIQQ